MTLFSSAERSVGLTAILASYDTSKVDVRIGLLWLQSCRHSFRAPLLFRWHDDQLVAIRAVDVATLTIDFDILAVVVPIPTSLKDRLSLRIRENNRCFIIYLWIDGRLDLLRDGGYGLGLFTVH